MGEAIAVGTSSRPHIHGLQGAGYVAHWTRTGNTVKGISDLGQAFTKFVQNGRRPGSAHSLGNHHLGEPYRARIDLWPENGLSYALQSGPTALVTYVPKAQERWTVGRLEGMMVLPRLNTVDEVQVDGKAVETYLGDPDGWVLVRSGDASMGLRFGCCEDELTRPVIFVERSRDHLFCGLRVCDFAEERELSEHLYRRFGVLIGSEVRHTPSEGKIEEMVADLRESEISDTWPMATFGGPREVSFEMGPTRLAGRLDPVSGTWLERIEPKATGLHRRMCLRR
jgi:hypothetical protein